MNRKSWRRSTGALKAAVLTIVAAGTSTVTYAAGEMGTGLPQFGTYAGSLGGYTAVWSLGSASIPMKAGCTTLYLMPATFGTEGYKIAMATLLTAKASGRRVRFYSHSESGCEVDYVELLD
jgi:hypothetical protein